MKKPSGFVKLDRDIMATPAWAALCPGEIAVLLLIWSRHTGTNNGKIPCGVREIADRLRCHTTTASRWLRGLEEKGFIQAMTKGTFNQKAGVGRATLWRLTTEKHDGQAPSAEFRRWHVQVVATAPKKPQQQDRAMGDNS